MPQLLMSKNKYKKQKKVLLHENNEKETYSCTFQIQNSFGPLRFECNNLLLGKVLNTNIVVSMEFILVL
jgi:hypothetical protein